jgi:hypothetical protein
MEKIHHQFIQFISLHHFDKVIDLQNWNLSLEEGIQLFREFHFSYRFSMTKYCKFFIQQYPYLLKNVIFTKTWIILQPKCFSFFPYEIQSNSDILKIYLSNFPSKIGSFQLSSDFLIQLLHLNSKIYFYLKKTQKNQLSFIHTALLGNQNFVKTYKIYRKIPFQYQNNSLLQDLALKLDWEVINHIQNPTLEHFKISFHTLFSYEESIHLGNFYKIFNIIPEKYFLNSDLFEMIIFKFEQYSTKLDENILCQINLFLEKSSKNSFVHDFLRTIYFDVSSKNISDIIHLHKNYQIYLNHHQMIQNIPIHNISKNILKI